MHSQYKEWRKGARQANIAGLKVSEKMIITEPVHQRFNERDREGLVNQLQRSPRNGGILAHPFQGSCFYGEMFHDPDFQEIKLDLTGRFDVTASKFGGVRNDTRLSQVGTFSKSE
uniref:Uncharacterized protein n=1 Tax=Sphaerodactylus townsendi TaxID=933632 RepID=A0ACB8EF71_9SAUR